uniref:Uncharacterized protein n=1 Tax=Arundo donax TaxID=35708 RepID=A0A0A9GHU2_ARUDO
MNLSLEQQLLSDVISIQPDRDHKGIAQACSLADRLWASKLCQHKLVMNYHCL